MTLVSWQGWQLRIPPRWSPVKLDGDYESGYALFADLHRPRLGLRWKRLGRRTNADDWAQLALRQEVGSLAAAEAHPLPPLDNAAAWRSPMLYLEPEPPGRDVFVAVSDVSGRALEVIHHARRRERILSETLVPTLGDLPMDRPVPWSIFELSCVVPATMRLKTQRLMAGDLSLSFANEKRELTVRQIAVAELALQRQPLEKWLAHQWANRVKRYRPAGEPSQIQWNIGGQSAPGLMRWIRRRRRFFYKWWLAPRRVVYVLHDRQRDRLVLVESTDDTLARQVVETVGFASRET